MTPRMPDKERWPNVTSEWVHNSYWHMTGGRQKLKENLVFLKSFFEVVWNIFLHI